MSKLKDFSLVSEVMCSHLGGIKCLDRIFVSKEYGKKLREIRGIQNNKLYYVDISDCGNLNRTLPIDLRFSVGSDNSIAVLVFKAIIPSTELDVNTLSHYRYRGIFDSTIRCLNALNDYYKGFIGDIRYE